VIAGIAFVIAFVNAVRGTVAYRSLVLAGRAADKQEALNAAERLAVRRRVMGAIQRAWGMVPASWTSAAWTTAKKISTAASSVRREPIPIRTPAAKPTPAPPAAVVAETATAVGELQPVYATAAPLPVAAPAVALAASPVPVATAAVPAIDQFPAYDDAPEVVSLADLIGSKPFRWKRTLAFLAANLAMGAIFILSRSVVLGNSLHAVYWKYALWHGIAMTLATLLAFRFVRKGWTAAAVASAGTLVLVLPVLQVMLLTFHGADLMYREEFQEFILVPFFDVAVTWIGLYYLLPRVRPLALGLWVGAACAEVATSMLITTLRDLGAGAPPDKVLYGALAFFVGVRSLAFAAVFWGGLKLAGIGRRAG
jgi:hypothetical protein